MPQEPRPQPIPPDYDQQPERFRIARSVVRRHGPGAGIHELVARRVLAERLTPVLDVGCGEGELARHLPDGSWFGVDSSRTMLDRAPEPALQADATALPFPDESFGSVALLYVLYHLRDPARAKRQYATTSSARECRPRVPGPRANHWTFHYRLPSAEHSSSRGRGDQPLLYGSLARGEKFAPRVRRRARQRSS